MTTPPNHNTADQSGAMQPTSSASSADIGNKRQIAATMANVLFNLAQKCGDTLTSDDCAMFDALRKQWDAAIVPQVVQAPIDDSVASMLRKHAYEMREHDADCDVAENMIAAATIIEIFDRQRAAPIVATVPSDLLNAEELAAFNRCVDCFDDGEGYDVPKPMMSRLASIGVLRHVGKGVYETTEFGMHIRLADIKQPDAAPSPTEQASDVRNAAIDACRNLCFEESAEAEKHGQFQAVNACAILAKRIFNLKSATPADKGNAPADQSTKGENK